MEKKDIAGLCAAHGKAPFKAPAALRDGAALAFENRVQIIQKF
jgi:hypothetical protein